MIALVLWLAPAEAGEPTNDPHAAMRRGPIPPESCTTCHSGDPTAVDPMLHVPVPRVCYSCHPDHQHVGIPSHLQQELPPEMAPRASAAKLPVWDGKVACVTCHDPHPHVADQVPKGPVVPDAFAEATERPSPVESDLLRLPLTGGALCVACHDPVKP